MEALLKTIVQTGVFMICTQTVIHFRPNASYEKYLKLLVGIMILIQVFTPVITLITGGLGHLEEKIGWYQEQLAGGMGWSEELEDQTEERLNRLSLEEIRKRIEEERWISADPQENEEIQTEGLEKDTNRKDGREENEKSENGAGEEGGEIHVDRIKIKLDEE